MINGENYGSSSESYDSTALMNLSDASLINCIFACKYGDDVCRWVCSQWSLVLAHCYLHLYSRPLSSPTLLRVFFLYQVQNVHTNDVGDLLYVAENDIIHPIREYYYNLDLCNQWHSLPAWYIFKSKQLLHSRLRRDRDRAVSKRRTISQAAAYNIHN